MNFDIGEVGKWLLAILGTAGIGSAVALRLRPTAQVQAEQNKTQMEIVKTVKELAARLVKVELRQVAYERHIDDLYMSIAKEDQATEERITGRLRTKRPVWEE